MEDHQSSAAGNLVGKKSQQLDELSKEELITKCKNLLVIAKKAKAAKDGMKES